ncbi:hypothetical protein BKA62DRAFT_758522 [Auriculariales sp. MPI-PUGE-AT-0066]|nr:hypothetical protein BKA62DRAFT_758522 [Auriculariales sp. MPI-PUGE-AT-0066]
MDIISLCHLSVGAIRLRVLQYAKVKLDVDKSTSEDDLGGILTLLSHQVMELNSEFDSLTQTSMILPPWDVLGTTWDSVLPLAKHPPCADCPEIQTTNDAEYGLPESDGMTPLCRSGGTVPTSHPPSASIASKCSPPSHSPPGTSHRPMELHTNPLCVATSTAIKNHTAPSLRITPSPSQACVRAHASEEPSNFPAEILRHIHHAARPPFAIPRKQGNLRTGRDAFAREATRGVWWWDTATLWGIVWCKVWVPRRKTREETGILGTRPAELGQGASEDVQPAKGHECRGAVVTRVRARAGTTTVVPMRISAENASRHASHSFLGAVCRLRAHSRGPQSTADLSRRRDLLLNRPAHTERATWHLAHSARDLALKIEACEPVRARRINLQAALNSDRRAWAACYVRNIGSSGRPRGHANARQSVSRRRASFGVETNGAARPGQWSLRARVKIDSYEIGDGASPRARAHELCSVRDAHATGAFTRAARWRGGDGGGSTVPVTEPNQKLVQNADFHARADGRQAAHAHARR